MTRLTRDDPSYGAQDTQDTQDTQSSLSPAWGAADDPATDLDESAALAPDAVPALAAYFGRYATINAPLGGVPFRVRCWLRAGGRLAGYEQIVQLDNLLARAVVQEATGRNGLPHSARPYSLPIPLRCLWWSPQGLPLWATTPLAPPGDPATWLHDVTYWHKRAQSGVWTGNERGVFAIRPTDGRWMERRVPIQTTLCEVLEATAIGHPQEVWRLLTTQIAWVGKKRHTGFGEVARWEVLPLDEGESFRLISPEGRLQRPLPLAAWVAAKVPAPNRAALGVALAPELAALGALPLPTSAPTPLGWTPPQWRASLFQLGWPYGEPYMADASGSAGASGS